MKLANGAQALGFALALIACVSSSACSLESSGLGGPDTSGAGGGSATGEPTGAGGAAAGAGGGGGASSAASAGSTASSSSGGAPVGDPCGPGSTIELHDDFDDDSIDDALWTAYGDPQLVAVLEKNHQVTVQPDKGGNHGGYVSNSPRSLIDCHLHIEIAQVVSSDDGAMAEVYFLLNVGPANRIEFKQIGSTLELISVVNNITEAKSTPYSTSDQRWWRFRESNGTVTWETSKDGQAWQVQRSMATSALGFVSAAKLDFGARGSNPNNGVAHFDNLNRDAGGM